MRYIVNVETQEIIEREATKDEKEQEKIAVNEYKKFKLEEDAKKQNKLNLLDKLGITEEEAKLLLG